MALVKGIFLHLYYFSILYEICFGNIQFKNPPPKILISERINTVILDEIKTGPIIMVTAQFDVLSPLLRSNLTRVVVDWKSRRRNYPPSGTFVLFARPNEITMLLRRSSLTNCKYVLVSDSLRPLEECFQGFWKYKILNVIALVESNLFHKEVKVFTYRPFSSKCGDTNPKLIGARYNSSDVRSLFPDLRKLKFNFCNLSFTIMHDIPEISISNSVVKVKGGMAQIFKAVRQHLEMAVIMWTGEEEWGPEAFAGSTWNHVPGYIWEVLASRADFSIGRFSWMYHNNTGAGFPMQVGTECITWAVPYGAGPLPSSWLLYTYQFSSITWCLCLAAVLLAGSFLVLIEPRINVPYLAVLKILFATGSNRQPSRDSSRVFLLHWALYSLVLSAAYQASTGSLVLVPPESGNIATKEQLIDSELILYADVEMHKLSERLDFGQEFKDPLVLYPRHSFLAVMYRVYSKKDAAVMSSERNIKYAWNTLRRLTNDSHILSVLPQCLFTSPTSIFLVREGSYLEAPIHRSLRYLSESGILKMWENVLEDDPPPRNFSQFKRNHPLSVHQTSGAFYILLTGFVVSAMVFLIESMHFKTVRGKNKYAALCKIIRNKCFFKISGK